MICTICGRHIENENANFCENCGTSLRELKSPTFQEYVTSQAIPQEQPKTENLNTLKSDSISFKTFFGIMMLQAIPLFGWLIYIVILFTWIFGDQYSTTHKNFAKASLLFLLLSVIVSAYAISSGLFNLSGIV